MLPNFELASTLNRPINNSELKGSWNVLYFYPRDNTPGCTTEALDFSALKEEFAQLNCQIWGISPDSLESHCKFIAKKELTFQLLSDTDHSFTEACGFWQLKKFMGKEFMGVVRSTLLIDPNGDIVHTWSPVKVKDHAADVLNQLKSKIS